MGGSWQPLLWSWGKVGKGGLGLGLGLWIGSKLLFWNLEVVGAYRLTFFLWMGPVWVTLGIGWLNFCLIFLGNQ